MRDASKKALAAAGLLAGFCAAQVAWAAERPAQTKKPATVETKSAGASHKTDKPAWITETLRGKVVWLDEALARLYGVAVEPATAHTEVALETPAGALVPIMSDTRGRAFAVDERLRDVELELLVRRYSGAPHVQVIRVRKHTPEGLRELDYWCDICAIRMYILKDCECCQGPTRLREEPAEAEGDSSGS
ncbi:MAG TPA: hypothetical protein VL175_05300 [Pirellulales bacterium]|jgi:hypothetical protein|nr:hypothetical protein [Pirellulales bacterium]